MSILLSVPILQKDAPRHVLHILVPTKTDYLLPTRAQRRRQNWKSKHTRAGTEGAQVCAQEHTQERAQECAHKSVAVNWLSNQIGKKQQCLAIPFKGATYT